jgi:hypothetical protein
MNRAGTAGKTPTEWELWNPTFGKEHQRWGTRQADREGQRKESASAQAGSVLIVC